VRHRSVDMAQQFNVALRHRDSETDHLDVHKVLKIIRVDLRADITSINVNTLCWFICIGMCARIMCATRPATISSPIDKPAVKPDHQQRHCDIVTDLRTISRDKNVPRFEPSCLLVFYAQYMIFSLNLVRKKDYVTVMSVGDDSNGCSSLSAASACTQTQYIQLMSK